SGSNLLSLRADASVFIQFAIWSYPAAVRISRSSLKSNLAARFHLARESKTKLSVRSFTYFPTSFGRGRITDRRFLACESRCTTIKQKPSMSLLMANQIIPRNLLQKMNWPEGAFQSHNLFT